MQTFIVLGIIPGIHYQTTFQFWVYVALGLTALPIVAHLFKLRHNLRAYVAARKISRFIDRYQLSA